MYYCLSKIMEKRQMEMYRERKRGGGVLLEEFYYLWGAFGFHKATKLQLSFYT